MPFAEDVHADRPITIAMLAISLGFVIGGLWSLLAGSDVSSGLGLLAVGALLAGIWRLFGVLHVKVEEQGLRARFGPRGLNLPAEEIDAARAEAYRWGSYFGWGMRWGLDEGRPGRAMSVPFLRRGIIVDTKQGGRHYISSRRPDELAAAINRMLQDPAVG